MPAAGELLPQDQVPLRGVELFPDPRDESAQLEAPDFYPDQAKGGVADGGGHFPDLAIFSLGELQANPAVGHIFTIADGRISRRQRGLGIQKPGPTREGCATFDTDALR